MAKQFSRGSLPAILFVLPIVALGSGVCTSAFEVCVDSASEQFEALAPATPDAFGMIQTHMSSESLSETVGQQAITIHESALAPGPYLLPLRKAQQTLPNPLRDVLMEFRDSRHPGLLLTMRAVETMEAAASHVIVEYRGILPAYLACFLGVAVLLLLASCRIGRTLDQLAASTSEDSPETEIETEDSDAASVRSSIDRGPGPAPAPPKKNDDAVSFFQLFRYATKWECVVMWFAIILSMIHGAIMPISLIRLSDVLTAIQMPNDDGSMPPAAGPHTQRDGEVRYLVILLLSLAIVGAICRGVAWQLSAIIAERIFVRIKIALFQKMMKVGVAWYDTNDPDEMTGVLSDQAYIFREGIGQELVHLSKSVVFSLLGMLLIFLLDWRAALLQAGVIPLTILAFGILVMGMGKSKSVSSQANVDASSVVASTLSASRTVAAFNGQERALQNHCGLIDKASLAERFLLYLQLVTMTSRSFGSSAALALTIFWKSLVVSREFEAECWASAPPFGSCENGSTILAVNFTLAVLTPAGIMPIPMSMEKVSAARVAAKRIYHHLDEKMPTNRFGKTVKELRGHIQYQSITFSYPSRPQVTVLSDFTLSVEAGTSCGFVGPSGSGKSTLIALLLRFYQPQDGQVLLDGQNVRDLNLAWLRSKMSLVEQEPVLFAGSILENIKRGSLVKVDFSQVERAAKLADAHDFIISLKDGYDTDLGERGVGISGGQKQRIAISRALVRDPAILLLDEATSALDAKSERLVQAALDRLIAGCAKGPGRRTTLIIAHRLSTVRRVDKICVLRNGCFVELGSPDELASNPSSAYSQLVALQVSEGAPSLANDEANQSDVSCADQHKKTSAQVSNTDTNAAVLDCKTSKEMMDESSLQPVSTLRLWRYAAADYHLYVLALVFSLASSFAMPVSIATMCATVHSMDRPPAAYDDISRTWVPIYDSEALTSTVTRNCFLFPVLGVISDAGLMLTIGMFMLASQQLTQRMFRITYGALLNQDIEWLEKQSVGMLRDRIAADVPRMKTLTGDSLAMLVVSGLQLTVVSVIGCLLCWRLLLTTFAGLIAPVIGSAALYAFTTRSHIDQTAGFVMEAISGIRTIAAFGCETGLEERFTRVVREESKKAVRSNVPQSVCMAINTFGWIFFTGGLCFFSSIFINRGLLDPSVSSIMLFMCMSLMTPISSVNEFAGDQALAKEAAKRIFAMIDRKPVINSSSPGGLKPKAMLGDVQFCNVNFSYTGSGSQILRDFNLSVKRGSAVALVGLSGCGKSSTLSLVSRFFDPTSGSVKVDENDIRNLNIHWLREHTSLVQQEPVLFAGSIEDNIKYGKTGATIEQVRAVAMIAQADGFISNLLDGYQTEAGRRGSKLSGGQKQRIAIARALIRKPSVLLLDEATSALDAVSEKKVMDGLERLRNEASMTMMIVAHRLCTIQDANKICVMSEGSIVQTGSHAELLQNVDGPYYRLVQLQRLDAKS